MTVPWHPIDRRAAVLVTMIDSAEMNDGLLQGEIETKSISNDEDIQTR